MSGVLIAPPDPRRRERSLAAPAARRGLRRVVFVLGLAGVAGAFTAAGIWWRSSHHTPPRAATLAARPDDRVATLESQLASTQAELAAAQRATAEVRATAEAWDPLESTCRHASLSIL